MSPAFRTMSAVLHPAWQRSSTFPSSASLMDRLGCKSSWAVHVATQASPLRETFSRCARTFRTGDSMLAGS